NTIRKVAPVGTNWVVTTLAALPDAQGSAGVAVDGTGNVYVADAGNHTIRKVTPSGTVTTRAGSAGQSGFADGLGSLARFNNPSGLALDSATNIYVADTWNHTIRKVTPARVVTTLAGMPGSAASSVLISLGRRVGRWSWKLRPIC